MNKPLQRSIRAKAIPTNLCMYTRHRSRFLSQELSIPSIYLSIHLSDYLFRMLFHRASNALLFSRRYRKEKKRSWRKPEGELVDVYVEAEIADGWMNVRDCVVLVEEV